MDGQDKVLIEIAVKALRAVLGNATTDRQRDQWKLAIDRVTQTRVDVEADEEIAALRGGTKLRDDALAMAAYKAGGGPAEGMLEALRKR